MLLLLLFFFNYFVSSFAFYCYNLSLGSMKTSRRASIALSTFGDILHNRHDGSVLEKYDASNAIVEWDQAKQRRPNKNPRKTYSPRTQSGTSGSASGEPEVTEESDSGSIFEDDDEEITNLI